MYVTSNLVIQKFVFLNISLFFIIFVIVMKKYRLLINSLITVIEVKTGVVLTNNLNLCHTSTPLHWRAASMFLSAALSMK